MKFFLFVFVFVLGCSDLSSEDIRLSNASEKSLLGSECKPGCIWSRYAVSSGVQTLTHYCDGVGCHCVEAGNIYNSCHNLEILAPERPDETSWETNEQPTASSQNHYSLIKGNRIADEAYWEANRRGTVGWCYNAVADAVERITGPFLWGGHAYQAADQFASSSHFFEVWERSLINLPAGAIVVWGKGTSRSGHISVALGNGQEASDHIASQMVYHYGGAPARVFLPR